MSIKLTMLGTGNALVTKCYNTCFLMDDGERKFLVDGGGGNRIFSQLEQADADWRDIHEIFITHRHMDHLMGVLWLIRFYCQGMNRGGFDGDAAIYGHDEVIDILKTMAECVLSTKETGFIGDRLKLIPVGDGETRKIFNRPITFFDIKSTKAKQYGFSMLYDNSKRFTCCGDEPFNPACRDYAQNSDWLTHEAFCLYAQADKFKPYEKSHSTVKDACELAESLGVKNLLLYHTEDDNIYNRKELYSLEGRQYFHGNLFIPDDLETLEL